jgi:hypothetical protein
LGNGLLRLSHDPNEARPAMRLIPGAIIAVLALAPKPLLADPAAAIGVGATTCNEFAQKYKQDPELAETVYFSWAQGFMSGWNYELLALNQPIQNLSSQSLRQQQAFVRNYCNQKPLAPFSEAVLKLYQTLDRRLP